MKFIFKMFLLVGLIVVGKYIKEDNASGIVKENTEINQSGYTLKSSTSIPFPQQTNKLEEPVIIKETNATEKTYTFSLN